MTDEELEGIITKVYAIAVDPPWCENVCVLKKWVEGFEACQSYVAALIDALKNGGRKQDE